MNYINNQWHEGEGALFHAVNPADGNIIWSGNMASKQQIEAAYTAAASHPLQKLSLAERISHIKYFTAIVTQKKAELTEIIALETGKPLWEAQTEATAVINKADLAIRAYRERTDDCDIEAGKSAIRYKPLGTVAVLGPFNFPAHLSNGHIIPALLAGNSVILKPSELTPATAQFIMQCWEESKLPPGAINLLQGDGSVASRLLDLPINGVFFTGSYPVGVKISQQLASRPEVLPALEMGGNNPLVIDDSVDIQAAAYTTIVSAFISAGQRCTAARRIIIPDTSFGDEFLQSLLDMCRNLVIGAYNDEPQPFIGPVIRYQHALHHLAAQEKLQEAGGKPLLTMQLLADNSGFLTPGIMDMSACSQHNDQEIFAPFTQIYRYHDFVDALDMANDTRYGLVAGLLSQRETRFKQFFHAVNTGLINWNCPTTGAMGNLPFGGTGKSGNHRPSGFFAADYCAFPVATLMQKNITVPDQTLPGIKV